MQMAQQCSHKMNTASFPICVLIIKKPKTLQSKLSPTLQQASSHSGTQYMNLGRLMVVSTEQMDDDNRLSECQET